MYNHSLANKKLNSSLLEGEKSVFKTERVPEKKEQPRKKEKLTKPSFHKRQERQGSIYAFYGVVFLISLISLGINFFQARLGGSVSSLLGMIFSFYCLFYTNPKRWSDDRKALAFWNTSVTVSVLVKSLHYNLFLWRKALMWVFASGLTLSYFISDSMTGVFGGLYLLLSLLFLAEQDFEEYAKVALGLAWVSVSGLILSLILAKSIPLGMVVIGLILYQLYERVSILKIKKPYSENEEE